MAELQDVKNEMMELQMQKRKLEFGIDQKNVFIPHTTRFLRGAFRSFFPARNFLSLLKTATYMHSSEP